VSEPQPGQAEQRDQRDRRRRRGGARQAHLDHRGRRRGAEPHVFDHQGDLDHGERAAEQHKADEAEPDVADRLVRGTEKGRQDAVDDPGLAAVSGDDPAEFGGDPGQWQAIESQPQEPSPLQAAPARQIKGGCEQEDEIEAERDHDAERPEQDRDVGHGGERRLMDLRGARVLDVGPHALQQQRIAAR
jgi:hypothetical protein